jgi:hypothetical protein
VQEELLQAMVQFGKWSCVCSLPSPLQEVVFLSGLIIGPSSKYAFFVYLNEDRVDQALMGSYHPLGAEPTHRMHQEPPVRFCPLTLWGTLKSLGDRLTQRHLVQLARTSTDNTQIEFTQAITCALDWLACVGS